MRVSSACSNSIRSRWTWSRTNCTPPSLQNTVPLIHADSGAWASGFTGAGQHVAILDSGVDKTHLFLAGKVVSEACYSTTNAAYGSTSLCPGGQDSIVSGSGVNCTGISGCDHGTHVAGIAAGKDPGGVGRNGVAKDANLIAIQVFSRFDSPSNCGSTAPCILSWSSDQMQALERVFALRGTYAIASGNMSLGGNGSTTNCDGDPLKPSIDNLRAVGIAVAIASGNNGYTNAISAPACISSAISVGSTCDSSNGYCAGVNSIAGYSNVASFISLLAPGSLVTSSVPGGGYASWHGTSMATPHVAGAWAVKKQQSPGASVSAILDDFRSSGVILNDTRSGGSVTGMKRIDFVAATSYTLAVSNGGNGTVTSVPMGINCAPVCAAAFGVGSQVTLTAAPSSASYEFVGWGGACSGTGSCAVTMNANTTVSASFQLANRAPVAQNNSYIGTAGNTMNITAAAGVLANDSDPDGNPLTAVLVSGAANGALALAGDGSFTYTPNTYYSGTDSFTYRASDGTLTSNTATVTLNIAPVTCTLPAAPTTLTAKAIARLRIQLAWTDLASNESGFKIERSANGGTWGTVASVGSNVANFTDKNLTAGFAYSYRVKAWNGCGESATTNVAGATAR